MTKDNPVAAGVATRCGPRLVPKGTPIPETNAASPVQAGIDPLVAEIVERLESHRGQQAVPVLLQDCRQAAALLRSQAERIAALERHIQLHSGDTASLNNDVELMRSHWLEAEERVTAAESLLAEAREALEAARAFIESFHFTVVDNTYKDVTLHLDEPHSLSLRLQNDSTKSWLFADLEERRRATLSRLKPGEKGGGE